MERMFLFLTAVVVYVGGTMSGTERNGIGVSVARMILILAIHGNRLVISTPSNSQQTSTAVESTRTAYTCENSELTISCNYNESIHVVNANYGRLTPHICNEDKMRDISKWDNQCVSNNSLLLLRNACSGETNCTVRAHNDVFGDPCVGTPKYLRVGYHCYSGNLTTSPFDKMTSETDMITSSTTSSTDGQPRCPAEKKRSVEWPATPINLNVTSTCPNNRNLTMAFRTCGQEKWNEFPDLSECISQEMLEISLKLESLRRNYSVSLCHEVMNGLHGVSQKNDLYGGDLMLLAKVMVEAVDLTERNGQTHITNADADRINEVVLNATSNLLLPKAEEIWRDLPPIYQSSTATRLLGSVDSSSALLANSINETLNFTREVPGLAVRVDVVEVDRMSSQPQQLTFTTSSGNQDQIAISLQDIMRGADKGFGRVTFALFDNIEKWLNTNDSATESQTTFEMTTSATADCNSSSVEPDSCCGVTPLTSVNSKVMSLAIVSRSAKVKGLQKPVQYILEHKTENYSNCSTPVCVFWKFSNKTFEGHWSDEGCRSVSSNSTYTVCECDHLTNFAILMSVTNHKMSAAHKFALDVITYIGCTISIVCLALSFITFYWFRGLQCDRNTIHKNLVLCLFIAEVIFLLGIGHVDGDVDGKKVPGVLCRVVAGFLHYFFLASFSWMCLEGVQLYVLLIEVFEAEKSRLKWYYLGAYGVPLLIVIISAASRPDGYGTDAYCWLAKDGLQWAFVGPAVAIICVNTVMLAVAIHTMCKHTSTNSAWKIKQKSKIDTIGSWVRGAVVLMILLGSTWTFGLLYVDQDSLFMAYIFTILNSLQGLFIFVFHCLTNEKVQKEYRRCIGRHTWLPEDVRIKYGGLSGSAALSTTPNQSNSSGMFSRLLKNRKRNHSLSSSSFQKSTSESTKKGNVLVVISSPGEGSSSSSVSSRKVKRHASSTSESARLTDSSGVHSNDYLCEQDEMTEAPSGYLDAVITRVDENEFNGSDIVETSALEESFIIADCRKYPR